NRGQSGNRCGRRVRWGYGCRPVLGRWRDGLLHRARRTEIDERRRRPQLVPEIDDDADGGRTEGAERDLERQARTWLPDLRFEDLARGGAVGHLRLAEVLRFERVLRLVRRDLVGEDLERLADIGQLGAREDRLFGYRRLAFDAQLARRGLAFRAALRL